MVMETAPPAPLIIAEAEFLLQLLIVALDAPAQLDEIDQTLKADLLGQCGKPIFGRLGFVFRPLDQQPLFGAWLAQLGIAMCRPHRDDRQTAVPSRQVMVCPASLGRLRASAFTAIGLCCSSPRNNVGGRP